MALKNNKRSKTIHTNERSYRYSGRLSKINNQNSRELPEFFYLKFVTNAIPCRRTDQDPNQVKIKKTNHSSRPDWYKQKRYESGVLICTAAMLLQIRTLFGAKHSYVPHTAR